MEGVRKMISFLLLGLFFCNFINVKNVNSAGIKGFDLFNYKPRKSQVGNISPQALGHYRHPWGNTFITKQK